MMLKRSVKHPDIENPDFLSKKQILCSHLLELF